MGSMSLYLKAGSLRKAVVVAVTLATTIVIAQPASAYDDSAGTAADTEQLVESLAPAAEVVVGTENAAGTVTAIGDTASTTTPSAGTGDVVVTGQAGIPVSIGLPAVADDATATLAHGGSVVYTDPEGLADVVVQPLEGGVRIQTVINGPNSPTVYAYPLDTGVTPVLNDDGSVDLVIEAGGVSVGIGHLDKPWAVDANGIAVPTEFVVTNGQLSQAVHHIGTAVTYPVVADPTVQADCGIITCTVRFNRTTTRNIRDGAALAGIAAGVVALIPGVDVVVGVIAAILGVHSIFAGRYYESGNCLGERFAKPEPGIWVPISVTYGSYNCR